MSDDNSQPGNGSSSKTWVERIVNLFHDEPRDRNDLVEVIDDAGDRAVIDEQTKEMIHGVLEVSDLRVRDVMIPRSQMITLDFDTPFDENLPIVLESNHSRFPVINEDKDHVEGILLAKDLLQFGFTAQNETLNLADVLRPAMNVPESKKVASLLRDFRQNRYHMAMVIDEYGGVSGLITIEDILERIVGDIEDEHDADDDNPDNIRQLSKSSYAVQALTPLEDFNEFFKTTFEEADTIGGIVLHAFGHMPSRGETIDIAGLQFKVTNADSRRIINLQVSTPKTTVKIPEETLD